MNEQIKAQRTSKRQNENSNTNINNYVNPLIMNTSDNLSNLTNSTNSTNSTNPDEFILTTGPNNPVASYTSGDVTYTMISGPKVYYSYVPQSSWIAGNNAVVNGNVITYTSQAPVTYNKKFEPSKNPIKFKSVLEEIKSLKRDIFGDENYDMLKFRSKDNRMKVKKIMQLEELLSFYLINNKK
jgi:hypothetical protein